MGCKAELTIEQGLEIGVALEFSDFFTDLSAGFAELAPFPKDMTQLESYLLEDMIPGYHNTDFNVKDLVDFLNYAPNESKLTAALASAKVNAMERGIGKLSINSVPDYIKSIDAFITSLKLKAENLAKTFIESEKQKDASLKDAQFAKEGLEKVWGTDYSDLAAYRAARFKNSLALDNMLRNSFINYGFINNVYLNVKDKKIIDQTQLPGKPSEIDNNLKKYRLSLLEKLVNKLPLSTILKGDTVPSDIKFTSELGNNLDMILPLIEDKVLHVNFKDKPLYLLDEGVLSSLSNEFSNTQDVNIKAILDNYVDYLSLADFDSLLKLYVPNSLYIDHNVDNFNLKQRKYSTSKIFSAEAYNATWKDQVQDGIELASDIYKTVLDTTDKLSFMTGESTNDTLYPAIVSEVFSKIYNQLDRTNLVNSIRKSILEKLNSSTDEFNNKDVLYTIYKKFFELPGDKLKLPKTNKNANVDSYLHTIRTSKVSDMHPLMLIIVKPLSEISKVFYAEASVNNGVGTISEINSKAKNQTLVLVKNAIIDSLNRSKEGVDELFSKYKITDNGGDFILKDPLSSNEFKINKKAEKSKYDLEFLIRLSKDVLNLDFIHNKGHKEFFNFLKLQASEGAVNPKFITFMYDALQLVNAKRLLNDPKILQQIKDTGTTSDYFLSSLIKNNAFGNYSVANYPNVKIDLDKYSSSFHDISNILEESENKYTGNRQKHTVYTAEKTTVAGFTTYNLFSGLTQNLNKTYKEINSVDHTGDSPIRNNMFVNDDTILKGLFVRGAATNEGVVKSNTKQNTLETTIYNIDVAYLSELGKAFTKGESQISAIFDVTVYSDKGTNFLPIINNNLGNDNGKSLFISKDSENNLRAIDSNTIARKLYDGNRDYYTVYGQNILNTWDKIYTEAKSIMDVGIKGQYGVADMLTNFNAKNDNFWNTGQFDHGLKGIDAARYYAAKAGVDLINWVHFQHNTKEITGKETLTVKEDLIKEIAGLEKDYSTWKIKYDNYAVDYVNNLIDIDYSFNEGSHEILNNLYPDLKTKKQSLFDGDKHRLITKGLKKATNVDEIHPALLKYFYDTNLVSENLMQATLGPIYAHKGNTPSAMLITQYKRNVAATASVRLYTLGLINGIEDETNTAFVDDFETELKTILSPSEKVVSFDGASFSTYSHRMKTWNSLNQDYGNDGGLDHKSFISSFDSKTGHFAETKHAEFTLTNELIRNSIGSDFDLYQYHKKLYVGDVSKVDITKTFGGKDLSNFTDVYYYDDKLDIANNKQGTIYQLNSIKFKNNDNGNSVYEITRTNLNNNEKEVAYKELHTFFDMWNTLGSYKSLVPSEIKTSKSIETKKGLQYFSTSHTASEKILDYEVYMGNDNENILYWNNISVFNNSDKDAYKLYKEIFNSNGVVDSHLKLMGDVAAGKGLPTNLNDFDLHKNMANPAILEAKIKIAYKPIMKMLNRSINEDFTFKSDASRKYQRFKGVNIDRVSTAGAQKVGQYNLNSNSTYLTSKADAKYESLNNNLKTNALLNQVENSYEDVLNKMIEQGLIEKDC